MWHSSMKNKLRKIRMIFYIENWHWKSNFGTFWHLPTIPILKTQKFHLVCSFLDKILSNFVPPDLKLYNRYYHNVKSRLMCKIYI